MSTPPNPTARVNPPPSQIQTQPPKVHFHTDQVPPSQYVYLQLNDTILISVLSNTAGLTLFVRYRYLTPEGEIKEGSTPFNLNGTFQFFNLPFLEGWLLSIGLQYSTAQPNAWVYAQVAISRGAVNFALTGVMGTIWEGYVPALAADGWPGTPSQRISDGPGFLINIQGSTPAAGADILEAVPLNRRRLLAAFSAALTTGVAVANRQVQFQLTDNLGNIYHSSAAFVNQVASTTIRYSLLAQFQTAADLAGNLLLGASIPLPLKNPLRLITKTVGIQAADQWTAPSYTFLEWGAWDSL